MHDLSCVWKVNVGSGVLERLLFHGFGRWRPRASQQTHSRDAHLMCPLGIYLWGWRTIIAVVVISQTGASCRVLGGMSYGRAMGAAGEFESGALINLL